MIDKETMWDIYRRIAKLPSRDQFERDWDEFCAMKRRKAMQ